MIIITALNQHLVDHAHIFFRAYKYTRGGSIVSLLVLVTEFSRTEWW